MRLIVSGDVYIDNNHLSSALFSDAIRSMFMQADYKCINLEAPITDSTEEHKIVKTGPHLKMSADGVSNVLSELSINLVTLANNHILDYNEIGLNQTLEFLDSENILHVGAGINLGEASKWIELEKDGIRVAIINFCENEWSIASKSTAGANPVNVINNYYQIRAAKKRVDKVICIVHGGKEYYHYPSPETQKRYRFYVESGADLVVGHHPHCISGFEEHGNGLIYYSLGNLLFTKNSKFPGWYFGIVLNINIDVSGQLKCDTVFTKQDRVDFKVTVLDGEERRVIEEAFNDYSRIIKNPLEIGKKWSEFVGESIESYSKYLSVSSYVENRYIKNIINRIGFFRRLVRKNILFLNLLRCEIHSELSIAVLKRLNDDAKK